MAATDITKQLVKGKYPDLPVAANGLDITFAAMDNVNMNKFKATGRELILIRNDDASPQTVTVVSTADERKRTGDITTYSIGAGEYAAFFPGLEGWADGSGEITLDPSAANLMVAVLQMPL